LEVLARKQGDCEDFAFLNMAVLRLLGYNPKFLAFTSTRDGHALCAFSDNGKNYYFNNMKLEEARGATILEFAENYVHEGTYMEAKELNVDTRKWKLLYKRL